jgi:transcriptional regulator with XRE-family HTH domain
MNFWEKKRERSGKTQQQIADEVGRSKQLVSAWERDLAVPPLELAHQLAAAYGSAVPRVLKEMQAQAQRIRKPKETVAAK